MARLAAALVALALLGAPASFRRATAREASAATAREASAERWAEADRYDIYAVRFATAGGRPASFWVLKGADGRVALVDAGFHRRQLEPAPAGDFIEPSEAIAPLGLKPSDVTDIVLTRLAWRQAGAVDLFGKARVWVQKPAFDYAVGDAWAEPSLHRDLDAGAVVSLVRRNTAGLLTLVRGDDDESISGVELHAGRGEGCRCQWVAVQSRHGRFALASSRADAMPQPSGVLVEDDPTLFDRFRRVTERIVDVR